MRVNASFTSLPFDRRRLGGDGGAAGGGVHQGRLGVRGVRTTDVDVGATCDDVLALEGGRLAALGSHLVFPLSPGGGWRKPVLHPLG